MPLFSSRHSPNKFGSALDLPKRVDYFELFLGANTLEVPTVAATGLFEADALSADFANTARRQ